MTYSFEMSKFRKHLQRYFIWSSKFWRRLMHGVAQSTSTIDKAMPSNLVSIIAMRVCQRCEDDVKLCSRQGSRPFRTLSSFQDNNGRACRCTQEQKGSDTTTEKGIDQARAIRGSSYTKDSGRDHCPRGRPNQNSRRLHAAAGEDHSHLRDLYALY